MMAFLFVGLSFVVQTPKSFKKEVIEFEVQTVPQIKKSLLVGPAKSKMTLLARSRGKAVSLKGMNLFNQNYSYKSSVKNDYEGSGALDDFKDSAGYSLGSDSFLGENNQWEFYRQVFERIDSQLLFDSLLAQYNHFGVVFVEFEVDAEGHFVDNRLKVSAEDSVLKVHAMRALRKGLREAFVKGKWNPSGKNAVLQAKFEFLQASDFINQQKQKEFGKPVFVFKRATSEKPTANNLTDTLLDADNLRNPYQIAERLEKYNKKKRLRACEFDPFESYKRDPDYNL